jgi:GTP 3',8-cyclase
MKIDYLRLSITDRCNLNCLYCDPIAKENILTHNEVLRYEEMQWLVTAFAAAGIRKVRITGGEPLIKKNFIDLVILLKKIIGLEELSLTTNGVYLRDSAQKLKEAGIDRINVSLDTLQKDRFRAITGNDHYNDVWQGITAALAAGFKTVKLNVVLLAGINDDEIIDFASLTFKYPLVVRFIEFFPVNGRAAKISGKMVSNEQVKEKLSACFGDLGEAVGVKGNGPAKYQLLKGALAPVGFISSYSEDFCHDCNRLRVDCTGRIYSCLFSPAECETRSLLRGGGSTAELASKIQEIMQTKKSCRYNRDNKPAIEMSNIGG